MKSNGNIGKYVIGEGVPNEVVEAIKRELRQLDSFVNENNGDSLVVRITVGKDGKHFAVSYRVTRCNGIPFNKVDASLISNNNISILEGFGAAYASYGSSKTESGKLINYVDATVSYSLPAKVKTDGMTGLTVNNLIRRIKEHPELYPNGLDSKIEIGLKPGGLYGIVIK